MAKLQAPLFSLRAAGAIGKTLVYFGWKGLKVVRSYVVPTNPNTDPQKTQRALMTEAVARIHEAQVDATNPLVGADVSAYALAGSLHPTPRTWFNEAVKNFIDTEVAGNTGIIFSDGDTTPGVESLAVEVYVIEDTPTAATFWYGTSKTSLINSEAGTVLGKKISATLATLTAGQKYYWRCISDVADPTEGAKSGIYYGVPTAA